jgi:hypothetical protein
MTGIFVGKIWKDRSGTALLTAMLVMGVLLAISITLSTLVLREVKITRDLMDSGKAYYSAESGIEEALYFLNNKLPGWSAPGESTFEKSGSKFSYSIKNTCKSYPCFDETDYDFTQGMPSDAEGLESFYGTLDLNQNILIPLFVVDKDSVVKPVKDFTVEFYADFDPGKDLKIDKLSGWDVLRWKVFGMKKDSETGGYVTEAISDFSPLAQSTAGRKSDAEQPSWFGTRNCSIVKIDDLQEDEDRSQEVNDSRITSGIICNIYVKPIDSIGYSKCDVSREARDYYGEADGSFGNQGCYSIEDFLSLHQTDQSTGLNYLSLTNMMNPAMLKEDKYPGEDQRASLSKIHFRVETYDDETVREIAEIVSDGFSGDSKQSLRVMKKKDTYMPVFNFSIYSTYGSDEYYCINASKEDKADPNSWYSKNCGVSS